MSEENTSLLFRVDANSLTDEQRRGFAAALKVFCDSVAIGAFVSAATQALARAAQDASWLHSNAAAAMQAVKGVAATAIASEGFAEFCRMAQAQRTAIERARILNESEAEELDTVA